MDRNLRRVFSLIIYLTTAFVSPSIVFADGPANVYKVTVSKFELFNGTSWVTIFEGTSTTIDIASVSAGASAGNFLSGLTVPDGTYTQVRVTPSGTFTIKGNDGGGNYTTATAGPGGGCTATVVAANEAECTVSIPGGVAAQIQTLSTPITVTGGVASYKVRVSFDVSSAIDTAGAIVPGEIFPAPPTVTMTAMAF